MPHFFANHSVFGNVGYIERIVGCLEVCLRAKDGWSFDEGSSQTLQDYLLSTVVRFPCLPRGPCNR